MSYDRTRFRSPVLCLGFAPLVAAADFRDIFIDPEDGMLDASIQPRSSRG